MNFVCTSDDETFSEQISEYFDIPVLVDYYILLEVIMSTDNHGKNMYYACYDKEKSSKLTIAVWDLDATCGQWYYATRPHDEMLRPEQDYTEYIINHEHGDFNLFRRLKHTNAEGFNDKVQERYWQLRSSYLLTYKLIARFDNAVTMFVNTGISDRESARWSGDTDINSQQIDFPSEMSFLADWLERRLNYLDLVRFKRVETSIDIDNNCTQQNIVVKRKGLEYNCSHPTILRIQNVSGKTVIERTMPSGTTFVPISPGVYIVGNKKVVIN